MIDVAKMLADFRAQPPTWWSAANRFLPQGVTGLLTVAIAYQLSTLTWALVPGGAPVAAFPARAMASRAAGPSPDYGALLDSHLFGQAAGEPQATAVPVLEAPDTTLSLSLTGIVAEDGDGDGSAVIKNSRSEELLYYVGQEVALADGATLHAVYADRVLLERGGRLETLRLPEELAAANAARGPALPRAQPSTASSLRDVISENAAEISSIVRASPHTQDGRLIGFRLTPGRNRAAFEALGFEPGDVVTEINGTLLDDLGRGAQIFQALGETTQATVSVLRNGAPEVLVVDTTQLQRIREGRE